MFVQILMRSTVYQNYFIKIFCLIFPYETPGTHASRYILHIYIYIYIYIEREREREKGREVEVRKKKREESDNFIKSL